MLLCKRFLWILISGLFFLPTASDANPGDQESFEEYRRRQKEAFRDFQQKETETSEEYVRRVEHLWGEFLRLGQGEWIGYSDSLETRTSIDFKTGIVRIETLVSEEGPESVGCAQRRIAGQVRAFLSADNPTQKPLLDSLLVFPDGTRVTTENAGQFVQQEVEPKIVKSASTPGVPKAKWGVMLPMSEDHLEVQVRRYIGLVRKWAAKYDLDVALLLAMIHTGSYFNPLAGIPLGGLMPFASKYAIRRAYRFLYAEDADVPVSFLYIPENNIALGATYLYLVMKGFRDIDDPVKRQYLAITAYKWGPDNVSKRILDPYYINKMSRKEVYELLKREVPEDLRGYLEDVVERMRYYRKL